MRHVVKYFLQIIFIRVPKKKNRARFKKIHRSPEHVMQKK